MQEDLPKFNTTNTTILSSNSSQVSTPDIRKTLSVFDVVKATGICKTKIYESIAAGHLVAKKYGARTLIMPEALDNFIASLPTKSIKNKRGQHEKVL